MNRKIIIMILAGALGGALFVFQAQAYGVGTHALLTQETFEFYNANSSNPLPEDLKNYLIDGSRHEDTNPRYLNHFYDPINNRGLDDKGFKGMSSKIWAQSSDSQTAIIYRALSYFPDATILDSAEYSKISSIYNSSDFTWQEAINLYANGEKEKAFFVLGHIIHLIQDASVPDHTRNDAHPPTDNGGSPYENFTEKFTLNNPDPDMDKRLSGRQPIFLSNLSQYFDSMANYSNNNFYSRDSVGNYVLPKPEFLKKIGNVNYIYNKIDGDEYNLGIASSFLWDEDLDILIDHPMVLIDYWSLLSTKAIQHGAGVIDLFLREGEAAKKKLALEKSQRPYLAMLMDGFRSIFNTEISIENEDVGLSVQKLAQMQVPSSTPTSPQADPLTAYDGGGLEAGQAPAPSATSTPVPTALAFNQTISTPVPTPVQYISSGGGDWKSETPTPTPTPPQADSLTVEEGGQGEGSRGGTQAGIASGPEAGQAPEPTPEVSGTPIPELTPEPTPEITPSPSPSIVPISGSSFLESAEFYADESGNYFLDLKLKDFPWAYLPHLASGQITPHNWFSLLFYYNFDAIPTDVIFYSFTTPVPPQYWGWGIAAPHGLKVSYPNCFKNGRMTKGSALILPATGADCDPLAANHSSAGYNYDQFPADMHFILPVLPTNFTPATLPRPRVDYVSVALYTYQPGYEPNNYAVAYTAADPRRFYFSGTPSQADPLTAEDGGGLEAGQAPTPILTPEPSEIPSPTPSETPLPSETPIPSETPPQADPL